MAETVVSSPSLERVTGTIAYAYGEWLRVPQYVQEWANWDEEQRLVFVLEWAKREDALEELDSWYLSGTLPAGSRELYARLQRIVETNRPLITPLLADDAP